MSKPGTIIRKHSATLAGLALVLVFVVIFFNGRRDTKPLHQVAMRMGLKTDDLVAMAPRISSQTGATVGTSRRIVYLMACSGVPTSVTLEAQARLAADIAEKKRITAREAANTVLGAIPSPEGVAALRGC